MQWETIKSLFFCRDVLPTTNVFPSFSPLKPWREGNRDKTAPFFPPPRFPPQPDSYFLLAPRLLFRPWKKLSRLCEFSFSHFPTRLFLDFRGETIGKTNWMNVCCSASRKTQVRPVFFPGKKVFGGVFPGWAGAIFGQFPGSSTFQKVTRRRKKFCYPPITPPKKHRLPSVFPENRNTKTYRIFCQRRLQSFPWPFQEY